MMWYSHKRTATTRTNFNHAQACANPMAFLTVDSTVKISWFRCLNIGLFEEGSRPSWSTGRCVCVSDGVPFAPLQRLQLQLTIAIDACSHPGHVFGSSVSICIYLMLLFRLFFSFHWIYTIQGLKNVSLKSIMLLPIHGARRTWPHG